jgi:hypothetical protein
VRKLNTGTVVAACHSYYFDVPMKDGKGLLDILNLYFSQLSDNKLIQVY